MGLSLPLDRFSFHYPNDHTVELAIHPELADEPARWQFWQFRPRLEYLVAICAERVGSQSSSLIVRQTVPLLSEETFEHQFLRISDARAAAGAIHLGIDHRLNGGTG